MYRMIDVCMLLQLSIRVPLALRCCYGRRRICVTSACPSIDVCTPRCASIDSQGSDSMSVVTQHRLRMALMTVTGFDWRPLRATVTINECRLHRTTCPVRGAPWCPVRPVRPRMPPHAPTCPRMPPHAPACPVMPGGARSCPEMSVCYAAPCLAGLEKTSEKPLNTHTFQN